MRADKKSEGRSGTWDTSVRPPPQLSEATIHSPLSGTAMVDRDILGLVVPRDPCVQDFFLLFA